MGYYAAATGRLGSRSTLDSDTYTPAASVSVRLVVDGTDIDAYLDAWHKIDTADSTHAAGGVAFAGQQPKFDNLAIGYDENADGDLNDANDTKPVAETFASTSTTFTYDQAGNLVDDGSFRYTYDAWNRLVKVTSSTDTDVTFHVREYYGDGRWSKKTVTNAGQYKGTVVPYHAGWKLIELRDGSGNMRQQFVRGTQYVDELVMMRRADHGDLYVHQDANWNVIALTGLGGAVVERYRYTPYGELTVDQVTSYGDYDGDGDVDDTDEAAIAGACAGANPSGSCRVLDLDFDNDVDASDATLFDALTQGAAKHPNMTASAVDFPFGHQGLYFDAEIGTYQNRHRQYDAPKRRFTQRDPLELQLMPLGEPGPLRSGQSCTENCRDLTNTCSLLCGGNFPCILCEEIDRWCHDGCYEGGPVEAIPPLDWDRIAALGSPIVSTRLADPAMTYCYLERDPLGRLDPTGLHCADSDNCPSYYLGGNGCNFIHGSELFGQCCNNHDCCYDCCLCIDRLDCEITFRSCMRAVCDGMPWLGRLACRWSANVIGAATFWGGEYWWAPCPTRESNCAHPEAEPLQQAVGVMF